MSRLAAGAEVEVGELRSPDRGRQVSKVRTLIAYVLVGRMGYGVREVASFPGRDPTTLSVLISRLTDRMQSEPKIEPDVDKLIQLAPIRHFFGLGNIAGTRPVRLQATGNRPCTFHPQ